MISLKTYNRSSLEDFIDSPEFYELPFLPISYHRAQSHIHNPRADEDDILLIIAHEQGNMVGYLGVLPDWIFDMNNRRSKCGWLSCMWIDPESRGKGISKILVAEALKSWHQKILVTEFTAPAKGLYDRTGAFKDLQIKQGVRLYIRSDLAKLLPPKNKYFRKTKSLWHLTDLVINLILDLRFVFQNRKISGAWEVVNDINDDLQKFIHHRQENQIFRRGQEELNWIMKYPWIKSGHADSQSKKYYFTSIAGIFEFKAMKLTDDMGKIVAFLMLARRDHSLKIPYCYFEEHFMDPVIACITSHLLQWKIKTCTLFHPRLVSYFQENKFPALFLRPFQRHYIISKVFEEFDPATDYDIQDGDADCAFT